MVDIVWYYGCKQTLAELQWDIQLASIIIVLFSVVIKAFTVIAFEILHFTATSGLKFKWHHL
jgi:hypothetical protein